MKSRAKLFGHAIHPVLIVFPLGLLEPSTRPARFPIGTDVRAMIQATPRVQVAHVEAGQLSLDAVWLPDAVPLLPVGLYLPRLRMRLPP